VSGLPTKGERADRSSVSPEGAEGFMERALKRWALKRLALALEVCQKVVQGVEVNP
jgi:hypothetical protein